MLKTVKLSNAQLIEIDIALKNHIKAIESDIEINLQSSFSIENKKKYLAYAKSALDEIECAA